MEKLLPYFERELSLLRRSCRQFAERYPQLASELLLIGESSADPNIDMLIQASALLNARVAKRLDDDYAGFTSALLGMLYAHYLRPLPSYSIARVDYSGAAPNAISNATVMPRGAQLSSAGGALACRFRTAYDVTVAPLAISAVRYAPQAGAPPGLRLPTDIAGRISITIASTTATLGLERCAVAALRVFIDGEPSLRAALRDALLMHVVRACIEVNGDGRWIALDAIPLKPVGFADDDALLPFAASQQAAYRLLTEYFCYPDKFNFVDIDLAMILTALAGRHAGPCAGIALHLLLSGAANGAVLAPLSNKHLLLGCTPVINLFPHAAAPISLTHTHSEYALRPDQLPGHAGDIYSVDTVHLVGGDGGASLKPYTPFYSLRHGAAARGQYWLLRRDDELAGSQPGHEHSIAFVDRDFSPNDDGSGAMSIRLTCSNRDLPAALQYGLPGGDLRTESGAGAYPIRLLRKPGATQRFQCGRGAHWGLLAHLSLNHRSLCDDGVEALSAVLRLYAPPGNAVAQRQIDGIKAIGQRGTTVWLRDGRNAAYLNGIEITVTLDEDAYVGAGLHLFIALLDHFFGLLVHLNSFTQLVALSSTTGKELLRCLPRNGALPLV